MEVAPEIAFRYVTPTDALKSLILERIDGLEAAHDRIISCRVVVENTTPSRHTGARYRIHVEVGVPGHPIVVDRDPPEGGKPRGVEQAIADAFDIVRRGLRELKRKQSGEVKTHELPPHGRVVRLLADGTGVRYGFLLTGDGRQIYFHENALVDLDFDDLEVGTEVRFTEAAGDEGPQASTVASLDARKVGRREEKSSVPFGIDRPG